MRQIFRNLRKYLIYHPGKCRNYSSKRESLMLQKIITKGEKHWKKKGCLTEATSLHQYARHTLSSPESRRKSVLNKIFMDHISDLMTTGAYADEIYNCGIHVTQTRITVNYHLLYVYWIHTKNINESEVNDLLRKTASYLRQELISARIMSRVPEVRFVKDEDFIEIQQTEEILDLLKNMKEESVTDQILFEQENVSNRLESQLPPMIYNVFGLEYLQIMNNIENVMRKYVVTPDREASTISKDHKKENNQIFDKKELARAIFSKKYEMKKSRRSGRESFESAPVEEYCDHETYETYKNYDDWTAENEEYNGESREPEEGQDEFEEPDEEGSK